MKTVDEVIDGLRDRIGFGDPVLVDAIHYLEEYRSDKVIWEVTRNGYLDWIDQYKESHEKYQQAVIELEKNPPLSWDELKQMVGKPVWVEYEGYTPDWEIIETVGATRGTVDDFTGNFIETHMSILHKDDLGKTWRAFRHERVRKDLLLR